MLGWSAVFLTVALISGLSSRSYATGSFTFDAPTIIAFIFTLLFVISLILRAFEGQGRRDDQMD